MVGGSAVRLVGCNEHISRLFSTLEQKEGISTLEQKEGIETRVPVLPIDDSEPISRSRRNSGADDTEGDS